MTESDWLASNDPAAMMRWLTTPFSERPIAHPQLPVSDRKLRLFACACCRQVWHLLTDERSRKAVEVAEWFADGGSGDHRICPVFPDLVMTDWGYCQHAFREGALVDRGSQPFAAELAYKCAGAIEGLIANNGLPRWFSVSTKFAVQQAAMLRDIFGNPWRPVDFMLIPYAGNCQKVETVHRIAQAIYDGRLFDHMPILADALEDAGCDNADVLAHCRNEERCDDCLGNGFQHSSPHYRQAFQCDHCASTGWIPLRGPHVRGCWVLDLLLGTI
jgi:hypothetical protein